MRPPPTYSAIFQSHRGPESGSEQTASGGGALLAHGGYSPSTRRSLLQAEKHAHPVRSVRAYVPATRSKSSR
jgi:hypothetical protein